MLKYVEPESIEPADCNGLKEDGDEKGEAGRVVLQQVEDVEPVLQKIFKKFQKKLKILAA